jgi:hypothetical protein
MAGRQRRVQPAVAPFRAPAERGSEGRPGGRAAAHHRRGWTADELSRYSFVYCQRENERVCVSIECFEPGTVPIGHGSVIGRKR